MLAIANQRSEPKTLAQAPVPHEDIQRKKQMSDAWKAYRGEFEDPLKVENGKQNNNVKPNKCAPIVDKGVSFLFGQVLKIEATEEVGNPESPIQMFLDGFWGDDDKRMTKLARLAMNGGVCGQMFVKLIPVSGSMKYPRMVILDPMLIRIVTSPDDCELILAYIIEYPGDNDTQKRQIIARIDPDNDTPSVGATDIRDYWTITQYEKRNQSNQWLMVKEPEEWLYPFAPVSTRQNLPNPNEAWGIPDLTKDIISQNNVLNFILSNMAQIIKFHAHPKTVAKGLSSSQIDIGVDGLICLPTTDSDISNVEMQSDLTSSQNFAATIRNGMNEQSRVPAIALGTDVPAGNVSGVALALFFQPLLEKTIQKQRLYGDLIREVSRAALVLANLIPVERFEDYPIDLKWQELLPIDKMALAQEALLLKQLGVSDATLLAELGYNPEKEVEKNEQEDERKLKMFAQGKGFPQAQGELNQQEEDERERSQANGASFGRDNE